MKFSNYDKYINSTGTHYISNSGGDEKSGTRGGTAGDQTGKEWQLRSFYSRPWTCVLRYEKDPRVGYLVACLGCAAALNNAIGYDQGQRVTYWNQLSKVGYDPSAITVACEEDCTAGVTANVKAAGYILGIDSLKKLSTSIYSGNMRSNFKSAGFTVLTDSKYLTSGKHLQAGDVLLYDSHHAATNVTIGSAIKGTYKIPDMTGVIVPVNGTVEPSPSPTPTTQDITNTYEVTGGTVNVRYGSGTSFGVYKTVREGDRLNKVDTTGWTPVEIDGKVYWISNKYIK